MSSAPRRDRACAFVRRHEHVLMVRHVHDGRDYWTLPGGAIEPGETPAHAAVRELAEETGQVGVAGPVLYRRSYLTAGSPVEETCHRVDVAPGVAILGSDPGDDSEHPMLIGVGWRPVASLLDDLQVGLALRAPD